LRQGQRRDIVAVVRSRSRAALARSANRSRADWLLRRLSEEGLRVTGQRALLVRAIADKAGAFAPELLVDELRPAGVARATVYRALDQLERIGLVTRIHSGRRPGYTVCDDGDGHHHHHHLVCATCQAVVPIDASRIEREIKVLAARLRFRLETHVLEFGGECAACLARGRSAGSR
jgi:Fur family ferric uptake transcriptional regulator